jgi:ADP-heptose:LPS heptosyltransferase
MTLNIPNRRERAVVALADGLLLPARLARLFRRADAAPPKKIICFRLERIGDLLMIVPALAALRALAPDAAIDLVVGSWNAEIAKAIRGIDRIETLDAAWLARPAVGLSPLGLAAAAAKWRRRRYDLAINFEPDIRSNVAAAAVGARRTAGYASGGGGPLLDVALPYDPRLHTADNAQSLVAAALGRVPEGPIDASLRLPDSHRDAAAHLLARFGDSLVAGIHVSGGRAVKQWPESRFREVAEHLLRDRGAAIVLTGTPHERKLLETVRAALPPGRVLDAAGLDLLTIAAVLERLDLFVTGDTGPMHLAHAVGTPIVAIFGPSDPKRYAPRGLHDVVVRIDLPCSPCNRIRRPPERCTGHTPDCLAGVDAAQVIAAIDEVLRATARRRR